MSFCKKLFNNLFIFNSYPFSLISKLTAFSISTQYHYRYLEHSFLYSTQRDLSASNLPPYFTEDILTPHRSYEFLTNKIKSDLISELRIIKIRVLKTQTGIEKRRLFSVAVAVGNGKGGLGYALGKDRSLLDAIQKATKLAEKAITYYDLYANRTLFHEDIVKFKNTTIIIRPMPPESGVRTHWAIQELCRCLGIKDLSAKVYGARTAINVVQCFLLALIRQKTPEKIARDSGMKVVDVLKIFNSGAKFIENSKLLYHRQKNGIRALRNQVPFSE